MPLAGSTGAHIANPQGRRWIGSGHEVSSGLTPEEMICEAGIDWKIQSVPLFAEVGGQAIETKHKALIRSDNNYVLEVVPEDWAPVQNAQAAAFFQDFCDEGQLSMYAAGEIDHGRKVWALAEIKREFELFGREVTKGYLLFTSPHIYGKAVDIRMIMRDLICENQLPLLLDMRTRDSVKITHRSEFNPDLARQAIGAVNEKFDKYANAAEVLAARKFSDEQVRQYFATLFPKTSGPDKGKVAGRFATEALKALDDQPGAEIGMGTWWRAYSAVTYLTTHVLGRKAELRQEKLWYGEAGGLGRKALNLALEMSDA